MRKIKKKINQTMEADIPRIAEIVKDRQALNEMVLSLCNRPSGTGIRLEFSQIQSGDTKRVGMELPSWMFERIRGQLRERMEGLGKALQSYNVEPRNL